MPAHLGGLQISVSVVLACIRNNKFFASCSPNDNWFQRFQTFFYYFENLFFHAEKVFMQRKDPNGLTVGKNL